MINYNCPHCGSDNTQSFALANKTLSHHYENQDLLPPVEPSNSGCMMGCMMIIPVNIAGVIVAIVASLCGYEKIAYLGGIVAVLAFALPYIMHVKGQRDYEKEMADYKIRKEEYDRSYVCLRCGERFIV